MQTNTSAKKVTTFHQEVYKGLTDYPKHISSKYFYDTRGDKLFQEIMAMPDYYLTNCEYEILEQYKKAITDHFKGTGTPFNLIELGAGDGKKTKILLRFLSEQKASFTYCPVDISKNALDNLRSSLKEELPGLDVAPVQGTYSETLQKLNDIQNRRKILMFLGSNIGNLLHHQAVEFLQGLQALMKAEDLLFVGFDLKKHPQKILNAYNDREGITEAFNKNLLLRINRELGGTFDPENFLHWEVYDPESGTARSFLVSNKKHEVFIEALQLTVPFEAWETIHTEISQKYDDQTVHWLAGKAGLMPIAQFSDSNRYYTDYLFMKK